MKVWKTIAKIVAALAVVAGVVYVIATYGERIVAWAKQMWARICAFFDRNCPCCCESDCEDCDCEGDCDECECECECDCDCTVEEIAEEAAEESVVAEEGDFEG